MKRRLPCPVHLQKVGASNGISFRVEMNISIRCPLPGFLEARVRMQPLFVISLHLLDFRDLGI